ncbi:hypothetical protein P175DRAFT_0348504 [Aspergillus ochraceoroseus IBT 24754]|uniref:Uncharacterized protein n=1 Tax=Aspergillus ochraceoroseus IBT 24754 TaxID=1392256 RepID=A0A2T5LP82_9EURO|nr:uncharacterized protein P175DRAFT_0348504 [Aspergillus ochraceoroseus IBT 24754]PTU18092.1 hypothetical protein P175DRAFT_0348504 [Aspergillus ochraceoroseus IBT 24754]
MFEDFSFSSPSSSRPPRLALDGDDRLMVDCDGSPISPMSSRCPSPRSSSTSRFPRSIPRSRSLYFRSPQPPPTSVPFSAYDDHKRLSISTLTRKLHEHTIQNPSSLDTSCPASPTTPQSATSSSRYFQGYSYVLTPPDTDHDDESYYADSTSSPLTSLSPSLSPQPQSPFLGPTSVPVDLPFLSAVEQPLQPQPQPQPQQQQQPNDPATGTTTGTADTWAAIRARRQHMSRMQCHSSDLEAIRRALLSNEDTIRIHPILTEDCHPSSLPPQQSPRRRTISSHSHRTRVRSQMSYESASPSTSTGPSISTEHPPLRRKSSVGIPAPTMTPLAPHPHRIEKSYQHSLDHRKKSEQGLRRKSLVSAALASMIERERGE